MLDVLSIHSDPKIDFLIRTCQKVILPASEMDIRICTAELSKLLKFGYVHIRNSEINSTTASQTAAQPNAEAASEAIAITAVVTGATDIAR
jgi:hypothetical protein